MANTYSQLYVQVVFAVKGRQSLISAEHREELHKYITGMVQFRDQKMLAVFAMPDHVHLLIGMKPTVCISDLVRDIKGGTSRFINEKKWVKGHFNWQHGFGAFTYSKSHVSRVVSYILNQEEHHRKKSFKEEYIDFLVKYEVEFDDKYLFEWIE